MANEKRKRKGTYKTLKAKEVKFKSPVGESWKMQHVTIALTPEQRADLSKLAGERITDLNISVEKLADLGDLIAN